MKTAQELADRLAELAGWALTDDGYWAHNGDTMYGTDHPFAVGSLDALEAFRREQLPEYTTLSVYGPGVDGPPDSWTVYIWKRKGHQFGNGPTFWDAYASALIAAKETP